jgi:hypothetical protein
MRKGKSEAFCSLPLLPKLSPNALAFLALGALLPILLVLFVLPDPWVGERDLGG